MGILLIVGILGVVICLPVTLSKVCELDKFRSFIWVICLFVVSIGLLTTGIVLEDKILRYVVVSKSAYWTFDVPGLEKSSVPLFVEDTLFDYSGFSIFHYDYHKYKVLKTGELKE